MVDVDWVLVMWGGTTVITLVDVIVLVEVMTGVCAVMVVVVGDFLMKTSVYLTWTIALPILFSAFDRGACESTWYLHVTAKENLFGPGHCCGALRDSRLPCGWETSRFT